MLWDEKEESQMRVIIAGGRDFKPLMKHARWLTELHEEIKMTQVVCGMQRGADLFGLSWALEHGIPINKKPADWDRYGKAAGPIRNREMAEVADAVVLFVGNNGTADMHQVALNCGLTVYDWRERE